MTDRAALLARWLDLTRTALPGMADEHAWPIRLDHCFMRVVLDNLVGRPWRDVLPGPAPAYRQLSAEQLRRAVELARSMLTDPTGRRTRELNDASLCFRGKVAGRPGGITMPPRGDTRDGL